MKIASMVIYAQFIFIFTRFVMEKRILPLAPYIGISISTNFFFLILVLFDQSAKSWTWFQKGKEK